MVSTTKLKHLLPNLEKCTHIAFVRENMLLATILDSLSIHNCETILGRRIVFGKLMGILVFFLQDFPQLTIHLVFLIWVHDSVPHADITVSLSLVVSCLAVCVSFFNLTMFQPNEFDPILL